MRVAVTGASGFIGQRVVSLLIAQGHEVYGITRVADQYPLSGASWVVADLLDNDESMQAMQVIQPDALIHLAWYTEHGKFWNAPESFVWSYATTRILEAFKRFGGSKIIVGGTCAEYDWSYGYLTEDVTPTAGSSIYGRCKDATRQYAFNYCDDNDLELIWARIFFPYGPGEPENRLIPSVLSALIGDKPVNCSHGRQYRDFIHVDDVASALTHMLTLDNSGLYNVASGAPILISSLVKLCASSFNSKSIINFGAISVDADEPYMIVGNIEKLIATGWYPTISIEKGIDRYIKLLRKPYET